MSITIPVLCNKGDGTLDLVNSWTVLSSLSLSSIPAGHRVLVFLGAGSFAGSLPNMAYYKLQYHSVDIPFSEERNFTSYSSPFPFHRFSIMSLVTSTGSGNIDFLARRDGSTEGAKVADYRLVALDLDAAPAGLPPQDNQGWKWVEDTTPIVPNIPGVIGATLTFVADGVSSYLVLGEAHSIGTAPYGGICTLELRDNRDADRPKQTRCDVGDSTQHHLSVAKLYTAPAFGTSITVSTALVEAFGNTTCLVDCSRLLLLRISAFNQSGGFYWGNTPTDYPDTNYHSAGSFTLTPDATANFLVIRRSEEPSTASPTSRLYYEKATVDGALQHEVGPNGCLGGNTPSFNYEQSLTMDVVSLAAGSRSFEYDLKGRVQYYPFFNRALMAAVELVVVVPPPALEVPLPSDVRAAVTDIVVAGRISVALSGDYTAPKLNKLSVASASQLAIATGYTGDPYTFESLGFKRGDRVLLKATGEIGAALVLPFAYITILAVEEGTPDGIGVIDLFYSSGNINIRWTAYGESPGSPQSIPGGIGTVPVALVSDSGHQMFIRLDTSYTGSDHVSVLVSHNFGANVDRELTIFDPADMTVVEVLVYPDNQSLGTPVAYKFYAIKRGAG